MSGDSMPSETSTCLGCRYLQTREQEQWEQVGTRLRVACVLCIDGLRRKQKWQPPVCCSIRCCCFCRLPPSRRSGSSAPGEGRLNDTVGGHTQAVVG